MSVFRLEVINFVPDLLRGGGSLHYDRTLVWIGLITLFMLSLSFTPLSLPL